MFVTDNIVLVAAIVYAVTDPNEDKESLIQRITIDGSKAEFTLDPRSVAARGCGQSRILESPYIH